MRTPPQESCPQCGNIFLEWRQSSVFCPVCKYKGSCCDGEVATTGRLNEFTTPDPTPWLPELVIDDGLDF